MNEDQKAEIRDSIMECQFELNRLGDIIAKTIDLLPPEMQDEVDPEHNFRNSPYRRYLEMMRAQPGIMMGGMWLNDPNEDRFLALEKYMQWTSADFERNEELFVRHNFPKDDAEHS